MKDQHAEAAHQAPKAFWTIGLVQFFCWFAFMFMWTYTNGSIAANAFDAPTVEHLVDGVTKVVLDTKSLQYQNAADWVAYCLPYKPSALCFGPSAYRCSRTVAGSTHSALFWEV